MIATDFGLSFHRVPFFSPQANCRQRSGRAGRVQAGECYRLVKEKTFKNRIPDHSIPEICRISLERLVLMSVACGYSDPVALLEEALDAPERLLIESAVTSLRQLGALIVPESQESHLSLTGLGRHLSAFAIDARLGKLLIYGTIFRCPAIVLTIAAAVSEGTIFVSPMDQREQADAAKRRFSWGRSDLLTQACAFQSWQSFCKENNGSFQQRREAEKLFCDENFLNLRILRNISDTRTQLASTLSDLGFGSTLKGWEDQEQFNTNSNSVKVVKAVLVACLYPNVVSVRPPAAVFKETASGTMALDPDDSKCVQYRQRNGQRVFIHPSSVNFAETKYISRWAVYLMKSSSDTKMFLRDCNEASSSGIILFCGRDLKVDHDKGLVIVDDWIPVSAPARTAILARELRARLDQMLLDKFDDPSVPLSDTALLTAFERLITDN